MKVVYVNAAKEGNEGRSINSGSTGVIQTVNVSIVTQFIKSQSQASQSRSCQSSNMAETTSPTKRRITLAEFVKRATEEDLGQLLAEVEGRSKIFPKLIFVMDPLARNMDTSASTM